MTTLFTSIVSDLLITIDKYAKKGWNNNGLRKSDCGNCEKSLSILAVKGFDDLPYIESIKIKIYLYTFMEADKA